MRWQGFYRSWVMVPKGWSQTRLENIAKIRSGSTPLRAKQDLYFSEDGTPWVKTLDLNNSEIIVTDERITELALKETSCSILPANTVLVAMYGGFNQIGRTGLLTQPSAINQALSGLVLDLERAEPKYVLDYLNGNVGQWKKFAASSRKDPNITRQDVCSFEILLPPLPEQQKIAKILSTWDKAISTTERLIDNSTQQKKALMQQLLTGKKRLLDESGKRFEGEWEEVKLGEISHITTGNSNREDSSLTGKYAFFDRSIDVRTSGIFLFDAEAVIVGGEGQDFVPKYFEGKFDLHQRTYAIMDFKNAYGKFLFYYIGYYRYYFLSQAVGSTVKSLRLPMFQKMPIKLPSIKEQQKIATVLTNADKEIELLEQQLADLQQEKKALMQVLLTGKKRVVVDGEV